VPDPDRPKLPDLLAAYREWDADEKAAKAAKAEIRPDIDAILRAQYEATGALPTNRVKGMGTALLQGGEPGVTISDMTAYADWCADRYPDDVELVFVVPRKHVDSNAFERIRETLQLLSTSTESRVSSHVIEALTAEGHADVESGRLITGEGDPVEGVHVHRRLPTLVIRPARD